MLDKVINAWYSERERKKNLKRKETNREGDKKLYPGSPIKETYIKELILIVST